MKRNLNFKKSSNLGYSHLSCTTSAIVGYLLISWALIFVRLVASFRYVTLTKLPASSTACILRRQGLRIDTGRPVLQAHDSFVSSTLGSVVTGRHLCTASFTWRTSYICLAIIIVVDLRQSRDKLNSCVPHRYPCKVKHADPLSSNHWMAAMTATGEIVVGGTGTMSLTKVAIALRRTSERYRSRLMSTVFPSVQVQRSWRAGLDSTW
jgi:hypothetical protein